MKIARVTALFFMLMLLPAIAPGKNTVQDQKGINIEELKLLLNSFAALGEGHIQTVLSGLRLMSITEEVQSGNWDKIKPLLSELSKSEIKAAALWFARPDGSYYTVDKDLTGLNLLDLPYFPGLMAGGEVVGRLDISKSTGKRIAIVAVPVKKDGKVIGALGASVSVEEISRMLDREMGLPEDMFFYALDQKGQTSLHRISALVLAYPSDMGSKSLTKSVNEMLTKAEGVVTYDFYGERTIVFKKSLLTGWTYAIGMVTGKPSPGAELPPVLNEFKGESMDEMNKMDRSLANAASELSKKDLNASGKRKILKELCQSYPYAIDCAIIDRNGKMRLIEPQRYAKFEGRDISGQEQVIRLHQSKGPVLSNVFKTVEGVDAADLEYPIFSSEGELAGSVKLLFRPEVLLSDILDPALRGMPVEAFVMQKDGRILYDQDKSEIGRMLFDDPIYKPFPQLLALGTLIAREKAGAGSYDFHQKGMKKLVRKDAHWTSIGLHGTEWRLVVMHIRTGEAGKEIEKGGTGPHGDALGTLAENAELKNALFDKDTARIGKIFRDFYQAHGGFYSIQWLDTAGINRYGFPEENSLINIDLKTAKTPPAKPLLQALSDKKETSFERPLMEGNTGIFHLVPVYKEGEYLGMIYTIQLKK